jgi:hypothetical protein
MDYTFEAQCLRVFTKVKIKYLHAYFGIWVLSLVHRCTMSNNKVGITMKQKTRENLLRIKGFMISVRLILLH